MPDSFKFQEVSEEFVVKEFKSLNISKRPQNLVQQIVRDGSSTYGLVPLVPF